MIHDELHPTSEGPRIAYDEALEKAQKQIITDLSEILKINGYIPPKQFSIEQLVEGVFPLETLTTVFQNTKLYSGNIFLAAIASSNFSNPKFLRNQLIPDLNNASTLEDAISTLRVALESELKIKLTPIVSEQVPSVEYAPTEEWTEIKKLLQDPHTPPETIADKLVPELQQLLSQDSPPEALYAPTQHFGSRDTKAAIAVDQSVDQFGRTQVLDPLSKDQEILAKLAGLEAVVNLIRHAISEIQQRSAKGKPVLTKTFVGTMVKEHGLGILGIDPLVNTLESLQYRIQCGQKPHDTMVLEAVKEMEPLILGDFVGNIAGILLDKLISHLRQQKAQNLQK